MHRQDRETRHNAFWKDLDARGMATEDAPHPPRPSTARELVTIFALSVAGGLLAIGIAVMLRGFIMGDGRLLAGYASGMRFLDALPLALGIAVASMPGFALLAPRSLGDAAAMIGGWAFMAVWMTAVLSIVY